MVRRRIVQKLHNNNAGNWRLGETMRIRTILRMIAFLALSAVSSTTMAQEVIRLRIASGHPPANTYVNLMQNFFVPEVTKRVAEKTKYKVEFVEGYGGAAKVAVERTVRELQDLRRQAASSIVLPGQAGAGFPPGGLGGGGKLQMP